MMTAKSDIRLKVLLVVFFIVNLIIIDIRQIGLMSMLMIWLAAALWLSKVDLGSLLKKVIRVYPMILVISILIPYNHNSSSATTDLLIFNIHTAGLVRFTEVNIKFIMILICTSIFSLSTPPQHFLSALQSMGVARWIIAVFFLLQRYLIILKDELHRLVAAFRSRYIYLNLLRRMHYITAMLTIFIVRTFSRSERIYQAMISRGFNGQIYIPLNQCWSRRDSLILSLNLLFFGGMIFIR